MIRSHNYYFCENNIITKRPKFKTKSEIALTKLKRID